MATPWKPRQRNYKFEKNKLSKATTKATSHPLKEGVELRSKPVQSKSKSTAKQASDPLKSVFDGTGDPLSMLTASNDPLSILAIGSQEVVHSKKSILSERSSKTDETDGEASDFTPWDSVKNEILAKYTTSEKLSITTSFLTSQSGEAMRTVHQTTTVSDKVKNRLEQLDDFEDGSVKEMLNLSQQDYVKRINDLNSALKTAWQADQRVKALKIAIQCAKMFSDVSVMQFYPSKFVLVTEILDTFGKLVYDRIWQKSTYKPAGSAKLVQLPEDFSPEQVPDSAKETCRNWFYKTASIRELIPRFYVEAALLKCYKFFKPSEMVQALSRLAVMCRGLGNPLVASYARCYLCRVGMKIKGAGQDYVRKSFDDLLLTYGQVQSEDVLAHVNAQSLSTSTYLSLYSPAVDWILQCLARNSTEALLVEILKECQKHSNGALLLNALLRSFDPQYIAGKAMMFVEMIRDSQDTTFPKYSLYVSLGKCLSQADPPESDKLRILNEVWKFITKLKEPSEYMQCALTWMDYVMKHFGKRELGTVLSDLIKHLTPDRMFEEFYTELLSVLSKILDHIHNFSLLFSMEKFLSFFDLFQKDSVKLNASRIIVEAFIKYQLETVNDPVIIGTIMFMCKTLHDSVNALSLDDECRAVSQTICSFIHKVDYGANFEQQLNFYVDSRANFTNLDAVITELVQCVNNLAVATRRRVNGNHTKKTSSFVRACAAYCFITIPSLDSVFIQLNLYLLSGQVALTNGCLSQAEALFKAGIASLLDTPTTLNVEGKPKSSEAFVIQFIKHFLSALLVVPDNPDQGVLLLIKGLVNVIKTYNFDGSQSTRVKLYTDVLSTLTAMSQQQYLYHVDKVDSNDTLYGSDNRFLTEVETVGAAVLGEILSQLQELSEGNENLRKQSQLSLVTLETIVAHGDLDCNPLLQLAKRLWSLSQKFGYSDPKYSTQVINLLKGRAHQSDGAAKLVSRLTAT